MDEWEMEGLIEGGGEVDVRGCGAVEGGWFMVRYLRSLFSVLEMVTCRVPTASCSVYAVNASPLFSPSVLPISHTHLHLRSQTIQRVHIRLPLLYDRILRVRHTDQ